MKKICKTCGFYSFYYIKGKNGFIRQRYGRCCKYRFPVTPVEHCVLWQETPYEEPIQNEMLLASLDNVLDDINIIKQIIKENKE